MKHGRNQEGRTREESIGEDEHESQELHRDFQYTAFLHGCSRDTHEANEDSNRSRPRAIQPTARVDERGQIFDGATTFLHS